MEIKKLRGYQAATESTHGDGVNVWFNGDTYNIVNFDENSIDLDRIATSLSRICRYAGHTKISVAEHSYMMAYSFLLMGDVDKAFEAWGHDLVEAYIGDTVGPLKKLIPLKPIEEGIEYKLAKYFGYKWPHSEEVHIADKNSSQTEMTMMSMYGYRHTGTESMNIFTDSTIGWEPEYAKKKFIEMYELIRMLLSYKEDSHKEETTKQYQTKEQYHQAEPHKWYQHQIYHNFDEIYKEIRRKAETKGSFITERFDDNWIDRRMELLSCAQIRHSDNIKLHRIQAEKGHMLIDALREVILNDNWQAASDALEKLENWPIIKEDLQKNHANHINMVAEEYSLIHSIWVHGRTVVLAQKLLQGMLDEHNLELSRQLVDGNQKVDIKLHGELHVDGSKQEVYEKTHKNSIEAFDEIIDEIEHKAETPGSFVTARFGDKWREIKRLDDKWRESKSDRQFYIKIHEKYESRRLALESILRKVLNGDTKTAFELLRIGYDNYEYGDNNLYNGWHLQKTTKDLTDLSWKTARTSILLFEKIKELVLQSMLVES